MWEIFEKLCELKGVTAYRVAQETGVTTATLSNWKADKYTPKQDKMQKLADYFGVSLDYLMTGKEKEEIDYGSQAELWVKIRHDEKMLNAIEKLCILSNRKKEHVFELIDLLAEVRYDS